MGAQLYRRSRRCSRLGRPASAVAGSLLCRRRQSARLRARRHRSARQKYRRCAGRQQILCRIAIARRAARPAQGAWHHRADLHGFRQPLVERSEEHRADAGADFGDRWGGAADCRRKLHPGHRGGWRLVEIAGRPNPPRFGVADQKRIIRQDPVLPCEFWHEVLMSVTRVGLAPLIVFVALGGLLAAAQAQQTPPAPAATPAAAPSLNILVVDVQALLQNSKSAKMVRQQIEQKRPEYQKEMSAQEGVLRTEHDTLQRQQGSLSAEAFNQKGREFQQKLNDFDKSMQSKRQVLEKANSEALEKINEVMLK